MEYKQLAIKVSNRDSHLFALFCTDKTLYLLDSRTGLLKTLASFEHFVLNNTAIEIYFCHPYIAVSERSGLNAAVINIDTNVVRYFNRQDYHADVSSYSIGFLQQEQRQLLLHQTQWNRLDITDLETGECLTNRQISAGDYVDGTVINRQNYLDYFHSRLHVSPDSQHFLSNGWVWSPVDNIRCFKVADFFQTYELASIRIDYCHGYNWDRPCTFIDNNTFLVITDDHQAELDDEELAEYQYSQFEYYCLTNSLQEGLLGSSKKIVADIFPRNGDGEVSGDIYYDKMWDVLIAVTEQGATVLSLEADIIKVMPEIQSGTKLPFKKDQPFSTACRWQYSIEHHFFYRFELSSKQIEVINIDV